MKMNVIILVWIVLVAGSCKTDTPLDSSRHSAIAESNVLTKPQTENIANKSAESNLTKVAAIETKDEKKGEPIKRVEKPSPAEPKKIVKKAELQNAIPPKPKVIKKSVKKIEPVEKPKPILFFPDTIHDYGFINEGDTIRHSFRFLNDGIVPLEILDVQVSCGCTIPVYSIEEIAPGRLSKIDVTFLSKGKLGPQEATIDVLTNARNPRQTLYLKGVIR